MRNKQEFDVSEPQAAAARQMTVSCIVQDCLLMGTCIIQRLILIVIICTVHILYFCTLSLKYKLHSNQNIARQKSFKIWITITFLRKLEMCNRNKNGILQSIFMSKHCTSMHCANLEKQAVVSILSNKSQHESTQTNNV